MMFKKAKGAALDPAPSAEAPTAAQAGPRYDRSISFDQDFSYDQDDETIEVETAEDTARYIADMIASLAYLAREARLDLLTYLLDMARVEAELQTRQSDAGDKADD